MADLLTPRDRDVLDALLAYPAGGTRWARPMDVGGTDGSHHSATLAKLCRRGLVVRARRNTLVNEYRLGRRGSWCYQIPHAGQIVVSPSEHEEGPS